MATGTQFPVFNQQFFDSTGTRPFVAAGYFLHTYESGTTVERDTFSDPVLTVPNENPIELNAAGKCILFADPALEYTFVLKRPDGTIVDTWDDIVSTPLPIDADFVPLDGSEQMTGPLLLSADATDNLGAVTKQQLDAAITAALASITDSIDAATAAAAEATAAAAAIKPESYFLASTAGTAKSRSVYLTAGTWEITLYTSAFLVDPGSYDFIVTQDATVSTTTVSTGVRFVRAGGAGFGRAIYGSHMAVGALTVTTAGTVTMSMAAASLGAAIGKGSLLILDKQ
jgi:hypothetical protein